MGYSTQAKQAQLRASISRISYIFDAESIDIKALPLIQQIVNIQMMPINCGPLTRHWYSFEPYNKYRGAFYSRTKEWEKENEQKKKRIRNQLFFDSPSSQYHSWVFPISSVFNLDATAKRNDSRFITYTPYTHRPPILVLLLMLLVVLMLLILKKNKSDTAIPKSSQTKSIYQKDIEMASNIHLNNSHIELNHLSSLFYLTLSLVWLVCVSVCAQNKIKLSILYRIYFKWRCAHILRSH